MDRETREILDMVARGELDRLTPEQIAYVEQTLADDPAAEAELAALQPPPPEPAFAVSAPSATAWDQAWQKIGGTAAPKRRSTSRSWRVFRPLLAAAASLVMVVLWNTNERGQAQAAEWPVTWASDVEVDDLEVAGDATPMVMQAGTGEPISFIWVVPEQG